MNDRWTFLHAADSHLGTPRSYRFRPAINQRWAAIKRQMSEIDAEFLLHGGDLTRDGETHEFEYLQAREDLDTLPFPAFVIPGNDQCDEFDSYGPWGHPSISERDYSVAREKPPLVPDSYDRS